MDLLQVQPLYRETLVGFTKKTQLTTKIERMSWKLQSSALTINLIFKFFLVNPTFEYLKEFVYAMWTLENNVLVK